MSQSCLSQRLRTGGRLLPVGLALLLAGCSNDLEMSRSGVIDERAWSVPETAPLDGYALLTEPHTQGLFPSAVGIARLQPAVEASPDTGEARWAVVPLAPAQATYWNTLMTHVPEVRELIVLDPASSERPALDVPGLLRSAQRRGAELCLAYGVTCDDPGGYRMGGMLFHVPSGERLAVVRAEAGPADFQPAPADRHETDLRHQDPAYLCARKLQGHVRDCLLALIAQDRPATTQPSPWLGAPPVAAPAPQIIVVPESVR